MPIKGWPLPRLGSGHARVPLRFALQGSLTLEMGELLSPWPDTQSGSFSSSWIYSHSLRAGGSS